jgi:hypothetical protein
MLRLFRGELAKTFSTRTLYAFALGTVAFSLLNAVIVGAASGDLHRVTEKEEALSCLPILWLVWGVVGAAGEYRHRTAAPAALVARSGRGPLLIARMSAYAVTGLGLAVLAGGAGLALAWPLLDAKPGPNLDLAQLVAVELGNLAVCAMSAVLGAALGALIRNQVVAVVVLLVLNFAVIPLVAGSQEGLMNLTPFGASSVLSRMTHNTTITVLAAAAILAGWTLLVTVAALAAEGRRDLA